jgi:hypothetical protein
MAGKGTSKCVFINAPFDELHKPLLGAMVFCVVRFGLQPRLASERLEAGENRLNKIVDLLKRCKYSIHDLSRSHAVTEGEAHRMNMPFEYGLDYGLRCSGKTKLAEKRFLIFERKPYDLKSALSDTAGQDVIAHEDRHDVVVKAVRDFFSVEVGLVVPGPASLTNEYATCQGWIVEKMMAQGHSETDALNLPMAEFIRAMQEWVTREVS